MRFSSIILLSFLLAVPVFAESGASLPMQRVPGGSFEVLLEVDGKDELFLVDTGAAMATINATLFRRLSKSGQLRESREVGARMADGRIRPAKVYAWDGFAMAGDCSMQSIEVLVVPGEGRNLLGMNVLSRHAPLTLAVDPPSLGLSSC